MPLTLYSAIECPFCVRTRLVLDGKRIVHDVVEIDLRDKPAWLRDLNPRNRVPVLDDGGSVLYESEALNEYLDETHPDPAMMPPDPAGRAHVRLLMRRFDDLSDAYYAARRDEPGARDALEAELASLDRLLAGREYLAGDAYTLADPGWWPWIARMHRVGVDVERHPAVAAWSRRLASRPEYSAEIRALGG
ncbi:MAG TPA: glutathione S-transferase family protein [Gaiellales bacterium]